MPPPEALSNALRTFVQEVARFLGDDRRANPLPAVEEDFWRRREDGHFQRARTIRPDWSPLAYGRWNELKALPAYAYANRELLADATVAHHLDKLVGAVGFGAQHMDLDDILTGLIETAISPETRTFRFNRGTFDAKWNQLWDALSSDNVTYVLIAPLPGFSASAFPVDVAPNLQIARLADDEVRHCIAVGILPLWPSMPVIAPDETVGIRWTASIQKQVGDEPPGIESDEGVFGRRAGALGAHRLVDDVLTVLRLFNPGKVWSPGAVGSLQKWMREGILGFFHRHGSRFRGGSYLLSEGEDVELQQLWKYLTSGVLETNRFRFLTASLRRFNFAFDRSAPQDRIIDLLIAAESLLLHDASSPSERGELKFRLALRAGKFVQHQTYTRRQVYDVMRKAYDVRSTIVHGGEVRAGDTPLPNQANASLTQFTDTVEDIIRRALRQATELSHTCADFGTAEFWADLLFRENSATI